MKKKTLLLLGICLAAICFACITFLGRTYTVHTMVPTSFTDVNQLTFTMQNDLIGDLVSTSDIILIKEKRLDNGALTIVLSAGKSGRAYLNVAYGNDTYYSDYYYIHPAGFITANSFLGDFTGSWVIPACISLYLAVIIFYFCRTLKERAIKFPYQYRNVTYFSIILYSVLLLLKQLLDFIGYNGILNTVFSVTGSFRFSAYVFLPVLILISLYVTGSNITLMRKEGKN